MKAQVKCRCRRTWRSLKQSPQASVVLVTQLRSRLPTINRGKVIEGREHPNVRDFLQFTESWNLQHKHTKYGNIPLDHYLICNSLPPESRWTSLVLHNYCQLALKWDSHWHPVKSRLGWVAKCHSQWQSPTLATVTQPAQHCLRLHGFSKLKHIQPSTHQENLIFTFLCLYCFFYLPQVKKVHSKKSTE